MCRFPANRLSRVEPIATTFYTVHAMSDTLTSLLYRVWGDLPAIVVELVLIGLCVNWCASVLQSTRGTRPLRGVLVMLVVATVVVRVFGWERLELLYSYVLAGLAFIALIVFQPELRRALIRAGDVPFHRSRGSQSQLVSALVKSAGYLSRNRYGALIAIQRDVDLTGWAENGTMINAEVSANLLNSIFFPNSALHDLGVIIRGTRIVAANCQFPSPDSDEIDAALGSRHLAAVGMSFESDALVLVVSEETGVISLADTGKLTRYLTLDDLAGEIETRLIRKRTLEAGPTRPMRMAGTAWRYCRRAMVVIPLALVIWYLADQATMVDTSVEMVLNVRHNDPTYIVDILEPKGSIVDARDPRALALTARFRGPARAIDQLRTDAAERTLNVTWELSEAYARPGSHELEPEDVRHVIEGLNVITTRGLTVEQVGLKEKLDLNVDKLVVLRVPVQVSNEPVPIEVERIDPPTVEVRIRSQDEVDLPLEPQLGIRAPLGEERLKGLIPDESRTFERVALEGRIGKVDVARMTPDTVTVAVRVVVGQQVTIKNVVVQLVVSPEIAARYEVEKIDANEWRIDVDVTGKEARLRELGPADIRAFVPVTSVQASEDPLRLLDVTVVTPEGVRVVADRARTVRVNVILRPGTTP